MKKSLLLALVSLCGLLDAAEIEEIFKEGLSHFEAKELHQALEKFLEVYKEKPENLRNRLELARTYMYMGEFQKAREHFYFVYSDKETPENVKSNIEKYLTYIDSTGSSSRLYGALLVGAEYSDNINSASDAIYSIPLFPDIIINDGMREEDFSHKELLSLKQRYAPQNSIWNLNSAFFAYNSTHFKQSYKDVEYFGLSTSQSFGAKNLQIGGKIAYGYLIYGSEGYSQNISFLPKIEYLFNNKESSIGVEGKIGLKEYFDDSEKNADIYEIAAFLKHQYGTIKATYGAQREIDEYRTDVDFRYYELAANLYSESYYGFKGDIGVEYKKRRYSDRDILFLSKRDDDEFNLYLGISKMLSKKMLLNLDYKYTNSSSNHEPFSYERNKISLDFAYLFTL